MQLRGLKVACAAAFLVLGAIASSGQAKADGCGQVGGWGGQCDYNYAPDGSHEHCDNGWAPFVGTIRNCFWVNTHP